jgi:hypothetical protein
MKSILYNEKEIHFVGETEAEVFNYELFEDSEKVTITAFVDLMKQKFNALHPFDGKIKLKKATLYKTVVVIIGSNDKMMTKLLSELTPEQATPLNLLLQAIGEANSIEYTKSTNILSIDGVEQPASDLGQTPLLDAIELTCVELLN